LIRQRNRRLFVTSAILLGIGSALFWAHPSGIWYWRGFFRGPQPTSGTELASPEFSPRRAGWISVDAAQPVDTGVEIYHTYSDGKKFLQGHYVLAQVDGYPLLIHVQSLREPSPYQGTLKPIEGSLKTQLAEKSYSSAGGAAGSDYLDTIGEDSFEHYREDGIDCLKAFSGFLLFGFPALWLSVGRTIDKSRHPFARALAKRGSLAANVQQIDLAMAHGARTLGRLRITPQWLILEKYWVPVPLRVSDVVRVYYKRDQTGPACFIDDKLGDTIQASMRSGMAQEAQKIIAAMAPTAIRS
jgi:hypothetical protein